MNLSTESFKTQQQRWPKTGRVILAQSDADSVVVYQAFRPSIGHYAARHGYFGGEFSMTRMTWIKPNFLWMMYRSGWGTKEGQEVTLAIRLARSAFDEILASAVHSSFDSRVYSSHERWKQDVETSNVRLQWDPDHGPTGVPLDRRAIQLGLRGQIVQKYVREWIFSIEDISDYVESQRQIMATGNLDRLVTPLETVFLVADPTVADRLGLDHGSP
jgi:hypothetical protein